ncbi:helix-turn-helix domain-containing protein [Streptomyces sp. H27-D2]|uniref:helix-turn-helix domain-containing protein n=1 Tax=Streptomyces sp. H27-D2 TaxID=3046304 RepID=UPI002DB8D13A|nr:helix-turn-helix transcriptional regulator [Streptomyces sp. H27-D2]MEC4018382.1 helix-turn-helix transcriptional regulator [Streptomyces sp. H27-D2]
MVTGPTVHRRQLGAELRRLRVAAGRLIGESAKALGCSDTRLSRIETGRGGAVAKERDVRVLCALYGVEDESKIDMLLTMLTNSQKRGWWESFEEVLPSGLEVYVGLETDARAERAWEPLLVHGLLQTPDYARTVIKATRTHRPADVDDLVQVRTERQRLLNREGNPLELWAVLDESVIRRPIGGAEVMRTQLRHLRETADLLNVMIQIVPFDKRSHPGLGGAFSLLEFEDEPSVVYVDNPAGNLYLEKERDVRRFVHAFDVLKAAAIDPDDSLALIERAAKEMR